MTNDYGKSIKILVSACLLKVECNYKGTFSSVAQTPVGEQLKSLISSGIIVVPVCPEQLGGLPTPRKPAEIVYNSEPIKVIDCDNKDVTINFLHGAKQVEWLARLYNIKHAVLKSNSPSCSIKKIHDGTFSNTLVDGMGVTARILYESNINLYDENNLVQLMSTISSISA